MNIRIAYRRARNALCFEKLPFAVTVKLDNMKAKISSTKSKYKTQAIPLKFWYRILVPDFPSWYRQIQLDLPHLLIENPTNCKKNVYFLFGLTFAVP